MAHHASVEDKDFLRRFEAYSLSPDDFDHRSHIRMAYIYLCRHDTQATCRAVRHALRGFLSHIGVEPSSKYHETMTRAWVLAVRHFRALAPATCSASEFIDANPKLLDTGIMQTHYSKELLFSDRARRTFVEPNLEPIPRYDETQS